MNNDVNNSRNHLLDCVPKKYRDKVESIMKRHATILNVLNSKRQIHQIEYFKLFSQKLYEDILMWFPCVHITPTVHKTLAHTWELIDLNGGFGLGSYSEEGLESCNKLLRKIRISLSRKATKESNQTDCMRRLWFRSDPEVNKIRHDSLPICKQCNTRGHGTRYCPSKAASDHDYESFFNPN